MAGNSGVIMRLERMVKELAVKNARLERRVAELEEQAEETDAKAEMLIDDVAMLDERTQSLNKEGRRCSD